MKNEDMKKLVEDIQTKLGKESSGKIQDSLGILLSDNTNVNKELNSKDKEIEKLRNDKDMLLETNSSLLKQVGMNSENDFPSYENTPTNKTEEKKKDFDFSKMFNSKGELI